MVLILDYKNNIASIKKADNLLINICEACFAKKLGK